MTKLTPSVLVLPLLVGCTVRTYPDPEPAPPATVYRAPPPAYEAPPPRPVVVATPPASTPYTGWELLGSLRVDGRNDRDSLRVGRREGRFSQIRFVVNNSAIVMHNVVVEFEDGTYYSPDTRLVFGEGTVSNVVDLPGTRRAIRKVDFRYSDLPGGGRAEVEVWAR